MSTRVRIPPSSATPVPKVTHIYTIQLLPLFLISFGSVKLLLGRLMGTQMGTEMKIESKSSIEKEPRTLFMDQIQDAREAALDVLNTKTTEEALSIFTEPTNNVEDGKLNMVDEDLSGHIVEDTKLSAVEGLRHFGSAPF